MCVVPNQVTSANFRDIKTHHDQSRWFFNNRERERERELTGKMRRNGDTRIVDATFIWAIHPVEDHRINRGLARRDILAEESKYHPGEKKGTCQLRKKKTLLTSPHSPRECSNTHLSAHACAEASSPASQPTAPTEYFLRTLLCASSHLENSLSFNIYIRNRVKP